MLKGTIKSYNEKNAFGFIDQDDEEEDLFFFKDAVRSDQIYQIAAGKRVEFVTAPGKKGPQGAKISIIED
ncbi:cold-shock protein [Lentilactobacillus curieae]|uniref:Cold-shock protein n=1 Tax=Lentilactobacillus curieae TaxID=1138822 RepID=A0A1S6QG42_9LACO|nr:cold shock domain-containing protein [Lentilactobacillus curieae]AQW20569.1 cold-shock protein [Lentilactobacillus curieae]